MRTDFAEEVPMTSRSSMRALSRIVMALAWLVCGATSLHAAPKKRPAERPVQPPAPRTVRIEASTRYEKSRIHEFTFGGGYRELWKAPIELPLLDLQNEAGGLTPTKRFGGNQTPVLAFKGKDGRS